MPGAVKPVRKPDDVAENILRRLARLVVPQVFLNAVVYHDFAVFNFSEKPMIPVVYSDNYYVLLTYSFPF